MQAPARAVARMRLGVASKTRFSAVVSKTRLGAIMSLVGVLAMTGCSSVSSLKNTFFGGGGIETAGQAAQKRLTGFIGGVAADEPNAVLRGREVLSFGGTAADAAVAIGFMLTATLPSRASLGAGGACLAYRPVKSGPGRGEPEAIMFPSVAPPSGSPGADRPAAVPMLARGLYALYARYGGKVPFQQLVGPAQQTAQLGFNVSRAFAYDLSAVGAPLLADPNARAVFGSNGVVLGEGARIVQPDLGATLAQLGTLGVGDLYTGALARKLEQVTPSAGGAITVADLRGAVPQIGTTITLPSGNDMIAFLPTDGGLAAAGAWQVLRANPADVQNANNRALGLAAQWRRGGGDPKSLLASQVPAASMPALPASTSFVTLDRDGDAVACSISMNNLFGTGRIAPGTGILLAASPSATPMPLLSAAIAYNTHVDAFHAEAASSGQDAAPLATAVALQNALRTGSPMAAAVPEPGRANVIACSRYLPGVEGSCHWASDPRGSGLATGSE